ncbi:MAG: phosphoadenosine phosphosulfate reductase family protein [Xenococcaceae cyanobacterium]
MAIFTGCSARPILIAVAKAIDNFISIPVGSQYILSFSGGKDSHVLLGIYNLYLKLGFKPINLIVRFADTKLEHRSLYRTIELTKVFCARQNIPFEVVVAKQSYWYVQFALGYPVPDFRIRWCTGKLKVQPMIPSRKLKSITGRHFGESKVRDERLKRRANLASKTRHRNARGCGSDTCGTDK